jgi:hypothetical protein
VHPTLTYEVQKAITQERLHNAALAQRTRLPRDDRQPRLTAELRRPLHRGFRAVLGLLGLLKATGVGC